jgi:hypothetical protein
VSRFSSCFVNFVTGTMTTTKKCKALKIEGNVVSLKMDSKILKLVRITSLIVSIIHT